MDDREILFNNIDKLHTTKMGADRIQRNLNLGTTDVVAYCKDKILDKHCDIYKQGKNWYCVAGNIKITVNAMCYTLITAHIVK